MYFISEKKYYFIFLVILVSNALILYFLPQNVIFNVDETEMSLSVLDRFTGTPSTSLAWPGGILQMIGVPVVAIRWFFGSSSITPVSFSEFVSYEYRNPWSLIFSIRIIVTFIYSVGVCALAQAFSDKVRQLSILTVLVLLVSTPEMWRYSHMAVGSAASIGLAAVALSVGSRRPTGNLTGPIAGLLFGLAVATKIPILLTGPFILGVSVSGSENQGKETLKWIVGAFAGFMLACPYLWVDPTRLGKSVLGNALRPGPSVGALEAATRALNIMGIPLLIGGALGAYTLFSKNKYYVTFGFSFSLLLIFYSISSSSLIYDRYFLPLILVFSYMSFYGFEYIFSVSTRIYKSNNSLPAKLRFIFYFLVCSLLAYNTFKHVNSHIVPKANSAKDVSRLVDSVQNLDCKEPVAVPRGNPNFGAIASSTSLRRQLERAWGAREERTFAEFARDRGLSPQVIRTFTPAFNEDEQAWTARLSAMSAAEGSGVNITFWDKSSSAKRFGVLTKEDIWEALRKGEVCGAVIQELPPKRLKKKVSIVSVFGDNTLVKVK